jgi:hypothetical protein
VFAILASDVPFFSPFNSRHNTRLAFENAYPSISVRTSKAFRYYFQANSAIDKGDEPKNVIFSKPSWKSKRRSKGVWSSSTYTATKEADVEPEGKNHKTESTLEGLQRQLMYDQFVKGNEEADLLAKQATEKKIHKEKIRNWEKEPISHVDEFYMVRKIEYQYTLEDKPPHKWIHKRGNRQKTREKQERRRKFLKNMHLIDRKRSFAGGKRNNHTDIQITLPIQIENACEPHGSEELSKSSSTGYGQPVQEVLCGNVPE